MSFLLRILAPGGIAIAGYFLLRWTAVSTVVASVATLALISIYVLVKIRAMVTEMNETLEAAEQAAVTATHRSNEA